MSASGADEARPLVRGRLRAWAAPGVDPFALVPPDGDPDRLLTRTDCRIVKHQPKVIVGRIATPAGILWVKRYNVFAPRLALASLWQASPARGAWGGAQAVAARGFAVPEPVAAIERRVAGVLRASFFITREVAGAVTADVFWQTILAEADPARRRAARHAFARALGDLFRRLHAAGIYHNDLKDVNVMVRGPLDAPEFVLLDLERVRIVAQLGRGRRRKNLVQLARTLGRHASAADRLRFLTAFLGAAAGREERRAWAAGVARHVVRKDRTKEPGVPAGAGPTLSCTIVCQNEERGIAHCLESVAWCDEIVVVDGGSTDRTVEIARTFTPRVITNPWPGYRDQKAFALAAATGEWVLNLDADERVTPELAAEIRQALARVPAGVDGFAVPRLVCYLGQWWFRGGWYPRRVVRVVRRARTRWGGTDPHERAEVAGRVLRMRWPILHYTYAGISDHLRSLNKLTAVAAATVRPSRRVGGARLVLEPGWRFVRAYLVRRGALDGFRGFFVAATGAFYVFVRWAKVLERRARDAPSDAGRGWRSSAGL